jgi:predicted neutral ceramidase superfamily lipid hydrolase
MYSVMKKEVLFSEVQRFKQWWLWVILFGINFLFIYGVVNQVILGNKFGDNPMSNSGLLIFFACSLAISILFVFLRLETVISPDGIFVRFYPVILKYRFYSWTTVKKAYIRQYRPLMEYGGWGVRYSLTGKGRAFNVSGNIGLQLEFINGEKVLIGTQVSDKMRDVLEQIKMYKV